MSSGIDKAPVSSFENICDLTGVSENTRMDQRKFCGMEAQVKTFVTCI